MLMNIMGNEKEKTSQLLSRKNTDFLSLFNIVVLPS